MYLLFRTHLYIQSNSVMANPQLGYVWARVCVSACASIHPPLSLNLDIRSNCQLAQKNCIRSCPAPPSFYPSVNSKALVYSTSVTVDVWMLEQTHCSLDMRWNLSCRGFTNIDNSTHPLPNVLLLGLTHLRNRFSNLYCFTLHRAPQQLYAPDSSLESTISYTYLEPGMAYRFGTG